MPIDITNVTPPDLPEAFIVADASFHAINRLFFTRYPPSPSSAAHLITLRTEEIKNAGTDTMFKAVDSETGKILAVSRWAVHEHNEPVTQSVEETVENMLWVCVPEMRREVVRAFFTMSAMGKREVLRVPCQNIADKPYQNVEDKDEEEQWQGMVQLRRRVELETLYVLPGFQRQGIASALVRWGVQRAEELGVVMYLEATEEGRPLYERFGFEAVKVVDFDAREYGGEGHHLYTFMVREPRGKTQPVE